MYDVKENIELKIKTILVNDYNIEPSLLEEVSSNLSEICIKDLVSLKHKDPALSFLSIQSVFSYSLSYRSVLYYRVNNYLLINKIASEETLTYYDYPDSHWTRIRTNNPMERIIREIRRRTCVVGAFPDGNSALMLCTARLRHIAGTRW